MIPEGFLFSAINADINGSSSEKEDLGLIYCKHPAFVSGAFTKNLVKAAPVIIGIDLVKKGAIRAIVANSGNANACTGDAGLTDAFMIMKCVASELGVGQQEVIPLSTGVIGVRLPAEKIIKKIAPLVEGLSPDALRFARSIMTTDTYPKICSEKAGRAKVLGIAKGSGMIAPDMACLAGRQATTLAVVLTDAKVDRQLLDIITENATEASFNAISVDGDTSTNDTLLVLTSNMIDADIADIKDAITNVIRELAMMVVRDGEGATKVASIMVKGTKTDQDAKKVAMCIANSLLVKTALFGADPNWGRIMAAIGRSGVKIDPNIISIKMGGLSVVDKGLEAKDFDEDSIRNVLSVHHWRSGPSARGGLKEILIEITLGDGPGRFKAWTTDLTYKYVEINSSYRT
ncbi:MAG: bifunctional glutamate N-acetyltransferase/amino-acid acetyltransferase ArgJ [Deltaproteobacteria bacterium]|nr:bifunctional glutamate N-acetyltransferase/amino-acid acetyltransferase ArgJ [Deltaproteobacteria bacterium]